MIINKIFFSLFVTVVLFCCCNSNRSQVKEDSTSHTSDQDSLRQIIKKDSLERENEINSVIQSTSLKVKAYELAETFVYTLIVDSLNITAVPNFPDANYEASTNDIIGNSKDSIFMISSYTDIQSPRFASVKRSKFIVKIKYEGGDPTDKYNWKLLSISNKYKSDYYKNNDFKR